MKNKKETYKTDHPIIKEITIGDQFILENGTIVTFVEYNEKEDHFPFTMRFEQIIQNYRTYSIKLRFYFNEFHTYNIKHKYIPLKDKINLL